MREIRPSGSEGGGAISALPTPIPILVQEKFTRRDHGRKNLYRSSHFSLAWHPCIPTAPE
jgi:hypothetical protein